MASFLSEQRGSGILLSTHRLSKVESFQALQFDKKPNAPAVWPAVLTSAMHSVSLGAALMSWIEVCKEVVGQDRQDVEVAAQTYYGRLLAVNGVCELVTSQLVGVVSDKHGRRPVQVAAQLGQVVDYTLAAICLPTFGLIPQLKGSSAWYALFVSRGIAGLLGNYKVSLQSYTADISSAEECPVRMAYLGGGIVVGMCGGAIVATSVKLAHFSFRASFVFATLMNMAIIGVVMTKWHEIAPRKDYAWRDLNPFASVHLLGINKAMVMYSILVFLSAFSLNMFSSTLLTYTTTFLKMSEANFSALLLMWTLESAACLGLVQPFLVREVGEIATLQVSFACMIVFYILFCLLTADNSSYAFVIMILFAMGSICYPLAVSLATREVPPELQGSLQGAVSVLETLAKIFAPVLASDVIIPAYDEPGQFFGMVYLVAGLLLIPSILPCQALYKLTSRIDPERTVMLEEISG